MKKGIIRAVVLSVVFLAAIVFFGYYTNQNGVNLTTEMPLPSFPMLKLEVRGSEVAELYGYADEMDMTSMRGAIIPVDEDRKVQANVHTYGRQIDDISYEIRSLDGSRLIAETTATFTQTDAENIGLDITLENLLEEGQEYQLIFYVTCSDQTIRYYARVMKDTGKDVERYLNFAKTCSEATFSADGEKKVSTYLEPDGSQPNSLNYVNIHSNVAMVCWGDFEGTPVGTPVFSIQELNDSYAIITAYYVLAATGQSGELEYYNVDEYYRVSYNEAGNRCYLHNYERTMNQIFRADGDVFAENHIQLGIRDGQVAYKKSENEKITCFEQQGEIWSYNENTKLLTRIFSFRGFEGIDIRENNKYTRAHILNVDEGGSVNYAVVGYMSRGIHEGQVGIGIYHFDSLTLTVEEMLFLPTDKAADRLLVDNQNIIYENPEGNLFLLYEDNLIKISLTDCQAQVIAGGLQSGQYLFDSEYHLFVWLDDEQNLKIMDLEKASVDQIPVSADEQFRLLGFLEGDLVYGVCRTTDKRMENDNYPMYRLVIYDPVQQAQLKTYEKNNYFLSSVEISDSVITLNRMTLTPEGYEPASPDAIMNQAGDELLDVNIVQNTDEVKQNVMLLALQEKVDASDVRLVGSKEIKLEEDRSLKLDMVQPKQGYYIYAYGECSAYADNVSDAIRLADEQFGTVVDTGLNYVWKRAKQAVVSPMNISVSETDPGSSLGRCLNGMLPDEYKNVELTAMLEERMPAAEILQKVMPEAGVYELRGCDLIQTLYYISGHCPVLAYDGDEKPCLLVGYDATSIWVYDPDTGQTNRQLLEEMAQKMNRASNHYVVYNR